METPIYIGIMVTAVFNGFGCSLFWPGSGIYVNECATDANKGLFNSIFWGISMIAMITGNALAAFVIPNTSQEFFYLIGVGINLFCIFYFLLIRNPLPH